MNYLIRTFERLYIIGLRFYPAEFRTEFSSEMQTVFSLGMVETQHSSDKQLWMLIWRELRYWPGSVLREHLRVRRKKMAKIGFEDYKQLSRLDWLAACLIFVLPLITIALSLIPLPRWMINILLVLIFGSIMGVLTLAVRRGLPPWSPPYMGFILVFIGLFWGFWGWLIYPSWMNVFSPMDSWSLPKKIIFRGLITTFTWFLILLSALVLVNLLRFLPHTGALWRRIREDWTQLSFLLYGGLVIFILLIFDEYHYASGWMFAACTSLAVGGWFYLRAREQVGRIISLVGGATGAIWLVAIAKWVLIPLQKWPTGYPIAPSEATRWMEMGSTIIGWVGF